MKKIYSLLAITALTLSAQTFNVATTSEFRTALGDAAGNGEDDTIILADGTYTTTDDGQGTFTYLDNEIYNLALIGSSSENVILSGAEQDQIFNHQSIAGGNLRVENLTFMDGGVDIEDNGIEGGGFYTARAHVDVLNCNFTNNHAESGGGFYIDNYGDINITNSVFENNSAFTEYSQSQGGGAFYSTDTCFIESSTFTNNTAFDKRDTYTSKGGGFYTSSAVINNSTFTNNRTDGDGGGFYAGMGTINDSNFTENKAYGTWISSGGDTMYTGSGGGFYIFNSSNLTIENSIFHKNVAGLTGGGFRSGSGYYGSKIIKSTFTENILYDPSASYAGGAGFYAYGNVVVFDSVIKNNHSESIGGGVSMTNGTIVNSIIADNYAENGAGAINAQSLYMSNSILSGNNSGILVRIGTIEDPVVIKNSVFLDNNDSIIDVRYESDDPIIDFKNNYINIDNVETRKFTSNNIFEGVTLGFVDEANDDFNLTASSDLIDAGTSDYADKFVVDGVNYLSTDFADNNRSVGANMDIGIYEYSTTKPTITSFTYSGTAKEYQEVTFSVAYTLTDPRTIGSVEFDYTDDGSFEYSNTHTFNDAKTYTVNVKVTDSSGEFSMNTLRILIEEIAYADMTDEEKLMESIEPAHYDDIVSIIESNENTAVSEAIDTVIANPTDYGLVLESDRKVVVIPMY